MMVMGMVMEMEMIEFISNLFYHYERREAKRFESIRLIDYISIIEPIDSISLDSRVLIL